MEALERSAIVGDRSQAALPEFGFDCLGVPRIDGPGEAPHCRRTGGLFEDGGTPMAHIQHGLLAIVAAERPSHQGHVERRFLPVIRDLKREVIQPHCFPARGFEYRCNRGCCDLFRQRASTLGLRVTVPATSLRKRGRPERDCQARPSRCDSQGLQQCATRHLSALVIKGFTGHAVHGARLCWKYRRWLLKLKSDRTAVESHAVAMAVRSAEVVDQLEVRAGGVKPGEQHVALRRAIRTAPGRRAGRPAGQSRSSCHRRTAAAEPTSRDVHWSGNRRTIAPIASPRR